MFEYYIRSQETENMSKSYNFEKIKKLLMELFNYCWETLKLFTKESEKISCKWGIPSIGQVRYSK